MRLSGGSNGQLKLARQDATRMHVTSGFYPGEGAKHDLGQKVEGAAREEGEVGRVGASRRSRKQRRIEEET